MPDKMKALTEIWKSFEGLSGEAVIPAEMAAVYLGVSEKTLARMRCSGDGPPYIQHRTNSKTKARNQKISYQLSDVREYRLSQKVRNTLQAAKVRGLV